MLLDAWDEVRHIARRYWKQGLIGITLVAVALVLLVNDR